MTKKPTEKELQDYLREHPETRYMELLVADINGKLRGKRAPLANLPKAFKNGVNFCAATVSLDTQGATFDTVPFGSLDGDPTSRRASFPAPSRRYPGPRCRRRRPC